MSLPRLIEKICKTENDKEFAKLMKTLPPTIQELFIEASLVARDKNIDHNISVRERVLKFFQSYIKQIDDTWVSTLLRDGEEILKCNDVNGEVEDWKECDKDFNRKLEEYEIEERQRMIEENPYGIIGKFNTETGSFCIVDFSKEKETRNKITQKREKGAIDKRLSYSGKVCGAGGWKIPELMNIVIKRLKIDPPQEYRSNESVEKMKTVIRQEKELMDILTDKEIEDASRNDLRRMLYWGTKKEKGNRGIKPICDALRIWLDQHGLLFPDNQCGKQGKKKIGLVVSKPIHKPTKQSFHIKTFIPKQDEESFKAYSADISRLMEECFGTEKYKPLINNDMWILVFSKKKLVGYVMIDSNNILWNVCVDKKYRRQGIARRAMKQATEYICGMKGKKPSLLVDNRSKDSKKLIRMYESFGFKIDRTDDRYIYMSHDCQDEG